MVYGIFQLVYHPSMYKVSYVWKCMHIEADIAFHSCIAFLVLVFVNDTVV